MDFVQIDRTALPSEEHNAAASIGHNLLALQLNAEDFRYSVELYLYAHGRKMAVQDPSEITRMIAWMRIAGRNGAIAAQSFAMVMQLIKETRAPTIWTKIDTAEKKAATKLFASEFADVAGIRNSTAHPGEIMGNPDELEIHRLKKGEVIGSAFFGEGAFVSDSMNAFDDRLEFGASYKGRWSGYELSMRTADVLDSAAQHYCRAFYPLEDAISAQRRAPLR